MCSNTSTTSVPGAVVVLDDYGGSGYDEQRRTIDEFLEGRPETIIALPTGQATFLKMGRETG